MKQARMLLFAIAQFVIFTAIAMIVFPGGSYYNRDADVYAFAMNYFSDLGSTTTFRGETNWLSCALFTIALCSVGTSLLAYTECMPILLPTSFSRRVAKTSLTLSGLGFIGIAILPWDLFPVLHFYCVKLAFASLLGYICCLIYSQTTTETKKLYLYMNLVYLVLLAAFVYTLFWGPSKQTLFGHMFHVVAQKIIVYASIINVGIQTLDQYKRFFSFKKNSLDQ